MAIHSYEPLTVLVSIIMILFSYLSHSCTLWTIPRPSLSLSFCLCCHFFYCPSHSLISYTDPQPWKCPRMKQELLLPAPPAFGLTSRWTAPRRVHAQVPHGRTAGELSECIQCCSMQPAVNTGPKYMSTSCREYSKITSDYLGKTLRNIGS